MVDLRASLPDAYQGHGHIEVDDVPTLETSHITDIDTGMAGSLPGQMEAENRR